MILNYSTKHVNHFENPNEIIHSFQEVLNYLSSICPLIEDSDSGNIGDTVLSILVFGDFSINSQVDVKGRIRFDFEESLEKLISYCNEFDKRINHSNLNFDIIAESLINLSRKFNFEWNQKMFYDDDRKKIEFT